jgi:hypothetical protein
MAQTEDMRMLIMVVSMIKISSTHFMYLGTEHKVMEHIYCRYSANVKIPIPT